MALKSWLLVPGGSEKQLAKAGGSGADAVVLDLVVPREFKDGARARAREWLTLHRSPLAQGQRFERWVRIDALETPFWRDDLVAAMTGGPEGVILSGAAGPMTLQHVAAEIYELEQRNGIASGCVRVMPEVGASARAALTIPAYLEASMPRLAGLVCGGAALARAIGASPLRDSKLGWCDAVRLVRAQTLLTARGREIIALDTMQADEADPASCAHAARAEGFSGMLASHPSQLEAVNAAFGLPGTEVEAVPAALGAL